MQYLRYIDTSVTTFLSNMIPDTFIARFVISTVTRLGGSVLIWLIPALIFVFVKRKGSLSYLAGYSASLGFASFLTHFVFKNIFMRARPFLVFDIEAPLCPQDFSFPSGHATLSFAAATMLASYDKKRKKWYYACALFISYTRIFLSCHFFFDVLAGALLGYCVSRGVLHVQQIFITAKNWN